MAKPLLPNWLVMLEIRARYQGHPAVALYYRHVSNAVAENPPKRKRLLTVSIGRVVVVNTP